MRSSRWTSGVALGCCLAFLTLALQGEAAVVKYDWSVDYLYTAPDCVEKLVAINGHFPSPTIYAVEGDTVEVKLTNLIPTAGVVLHWHGILQDETPFDDGAAGPNVFTKCMNLRHNLNLVFLSLVLKNVSNPIE